MAPLLHPFFEDQADSHPGNTALLCHGELFTYGMLEHRANQMAHWLRSQGVSRGDLVCLLLDRSVDFYYCLLGILKAGAAYVPIDAGYPVDRIQYIVKNSGAKWVLSTQQFSEKLNDLPCSLAFLDQLEKTLGEQPTARPEAVNAPDDLCYVIYTSGTTGWPKGVAITHENVSNYVTAATAIYGITATDRVYQGFSVAFDASVEEIWLAFANGGALVAGAYDTVHAGAGLIDFLNFHHVTVFSTVPTMLAMLEGDLPTLRTLILGGEVCPQPLVAKWMRQGLRIFNTYGPTETTVVATYHECQPNQPITIGQPIANCNVLIVDETLQPVKTGEIGELCISGKNVARGYLHQPELTAKKFITHPLHPNERLYRTGDLVYQTENGELQFAGRVDEQIKLRGYRIELSEIEAALQQFPGVKQAAVKACELVKGVTSLVAYVVLQPHSNLQTEAITEFLQTRLPPYMLPAFFEVLTEFPHLASGKIDKKKLPVPVHHVNAQQTTYRAPNTTLEKDIASVWQAVLQVQSVSITDDFFYQLGGHSLLAATIVSRLRKSPNMRHVSTLHLYENPTIERLAKRIETENQEMQQRDDNVNTHEDALLDKQTRKSLTHVAQAIGVYVQFLFSSWPFLCLFLLITWASETDDIFSLKFVGTLLLTLVIMQPAVLGFAVLAKWLLLGRIRPGKYKIGSWYALRFWLVAHIQKTTIIDYLTGSPLINFYYRCMGAKIGKNCYIGTAQVGAYDLFSMDDNSSVGDDVMLLGYTYEKGYLKIGSIEIGQDCYVGANSVIGIHTQLNDAAKLGEHSMLSEGMVLQANQCYIGSPARAGHVNLADLTHAAQHAASNEDRPYLYASLHVLGLIAVLLVYSLSLLPGIALLDYYVFYHPSLLNCLWAVPLSGLLFIALLCLNTILVKRLILRNVTPGCYSLQSVFYIRKWTSERLLALSLNVTQCIYATLYASAWFRALGAHIGKRTELSTVQCSSPDLLHIGDECFVADGGILGAAKIYKNQMQLEEVHLGNRVFIGNQAIVPFTSSIDDNCLIACLSLPPNVQQVPANTSWFGSPAVLLPRREIFTGFTEKETYIPTLKLRIGRALVDFCKITVPPILSFCMLALQFMAINLLLHNIDIALLFCVFPVIDMAIACGIAFFIIGLKWLLIGEYKETAKPAWSLYVWVSEFITGLYDAMLTPILLDKLTGTPFIAFFLRLLGTRIGNNTHIDSPFFSEFDLVEMGDRVCINADSTIQTHLFEDRVMKMAALKIEDDCNVGHRAIVLYGSVMENHATLADLSLLMKGEMLPAYSYWEGVPAQHIASQHPVKLAIDALPATPNPELIS